MWREILHIWTPWFWLLVVLPDTHETTIFLINIVFPVMLTNMMNPLKPTVQFDDFAKLDMRIGTVVSVEAVPNSEKLVRMMVDIGEKDEAGNPKYRQIIAGIKKWYPPETLIGRQIVIAANLAPRKLAGLESQGMLIAGHTEDGGAVIVSPEQPVFNGSHLS